MITYNVACKKSDFQATKRFLDRNSDFQNCKVDFKSSFDIFRSSQISNPVKPKKPLFLLYKNALSFSGAICFAEQTINTLGPKANKLFKNIGVIIDEFNRPTIHLNGNPIPDMPHGTFLLKLANIFAPESRKLCFPSRTTAQTLRRLKQVNKLVDKGISIKAVNLSIGVINDVCDLSNNLRMHITTDNIKKLREPIIKALRANGDLGYLDTANAIDEIEKLVNKGVKVFVCAGNGRIDTVNLNSLAKGVNVVSAVDDSGRLSPMFASNSLTTDAGPGYLRLKEVNGVNGKFEGLSVTGNNVAEIPAAAIKHHFSYFKLFIGKRPEEVVAPISQYSEFINFQKQGKRIEEAPLYLKEKLYSVDVLKSMLANDPLANQHYYLKAIKESNWTNAYCPIVPFHCYDAKLKPNLSKLNAFFDIDSNTGLIRFSDTLYSNVPVGANGIANGTSFSSVIKFAQYLKDLALSTIQ